MSEELPPVVVRAKGPFCQAGFDARDWSCSNCSGRGGTYVEEDGYQVFRPCACRKAIRRQELFNAANIGRRFVDATLDSFVPSTPEQQRAHQLVRDFTLMYPRVRGGLLLWGPVGTGKSHLVVGMFRELTLRKGVACRFVDYGNLLADIKRSFSASTGDAALMLPLVDVELLVIDELGKGRGTEWEETVLDDIISRRYNAGRVTLCTTNVSPGDGGGAASESHNSSFASRERSAAGRSSLSLRDRVGERIYSRLCEMCEFVQVRGTDFRQTSQGVSRRS